jgi:hypothetical protein
VYEERDEAGVRYLDRQVSFAFQSGFAPVAERRFEPHYFELDVLLAASDLLSLPCLDDVIFFGVMRHYVGRRCWSRPEFDTLALGHALRFARRRGQPARRIESNCRLIVHPAAVELVVSTLTRNRASLNAHPALLQEHQRGLGRAGITG